MASLEDSYKNVQTLEDLRNFLAVWEKQLIDISLDSITSKTGKYYIKTTRFTPAGRHFKIDLIDQLEFERIAKNYNYNLENQNHIKYTIARIAELIALKKLARILIKYKQKLPKPILKACFVEEHALYDIYIPSVNLYIDVKAKNVETSRVYKVLKQRATEPNNKEIVYFTQTHNDDKLRVLKMIDTHELISLKFYSFAFAINYPNHKYNDLIIMDGDYTTPATIQGTILDGQITSLKEMLKDVENQKIDKYYRIGYMDEHEKRFLKNLEEEIELKIMGDK